MSKKIKNVRYALVAVLLLVCAAMQAQSISGNVKDSNGEPIIGATVMEQGTQNGTVTDFDGNFTLKLQKGGNVNVSYVGMKPQVVATSGKSSLNIMLQEDNTTLNDVVVVGYGTMKRKDLTGSVASVTGDKIAANPVANVAEALQGQLSGVNVMSQDGRPGATQSIRVRGGGSITQSNDPLFIVDGVVVSSIDDIPADNIESIDVLKDAASTAIYGARGANGVILVTTKTGKEGKVQVKYGMYYQIMSKPTQMETESASDIVLRDWSYATMYGTGDAVAKFYGVGSANGNHFSEYANMGTHNYVDDITQTGHMWNHDLSISGGTAKTKFYAAANYTDNVGTLKNSDYGRWNINLKLQQEIAKTLSLDLNARYGETTISGNDNAYAYASQAYRYAPIDNILGSNDVADLGSNAYDENRNPLDMINDVANDRKAQRVSLNGALTWRAFKGFTAKTELYVGRNWSQTETWLGGHYYDFDDKYVKNSYSTATLSKKDGWNTRWDTTLNYEVQGLGEDHSLNVLVGNEVIGSRSDTFSFSGSGYPTEWTMEQAIGNINLYDTTYNSTLKNTIGINSNTLSWFGRMNYSFLSRYLLTFTMRADGSSKFAKDKRWGYFPAGAVAWRISDEPFLKNASDWLDNLKLRLSFGTSGNDQIDSDAFYTSWTAKTKTVAGQEVKYYVPNTNLGNPDLTWEKTISRNVGIDYSFLNGKFNGAVDFYWNTTKDCLMLVPCNSTSGFSYQYQNVAQTSNKGIEFSFNYNIIHTKDFSLSFGLTHNFNVNNVDKLIDGVNASADARQVWGSTLAQPTNDYLVKEGEPVGLIQGFQSEGFYTVDDFNVVDGVWTLKDGVKDCTVGTYADAIKKGYNIPEGQSAFPGMCKYADINEDGKVTDEDVTIIGRTKAKHTGGFRFNGNYKGLDFSVNFTYQLGGKVYNANAMHDMYNDKSTLIGWARVSNISDCWKSYDVDSNGDIYLVTEPTELANLNASAKYGTPYSMNGVVSSDFVEDASYLRLQTLTIGYTFPKVWTNKVHISNARIYFTAGNLFCLKKYTGIDPEVNVSPSADSGYSGFPTTNFDYRSYPRSRTFTFGLNVAF